MSEDDCIICSKWPERDRWALQEMLDTLPARRRTRLRRMLDGLLEKLRRRTRAEQPAQTLVFESPGVKIHRLDYAHSGPAQKSVKYRYAYNAAL